MREGETVTPPDENYGTVPELTEEPPHVTKNLEGGELPVERDMLAELHRELEEKKQELEREYPTSYVEQAFQEFGEGMQQ